MRVDDEKPASNNNATPQQNDVPKQLSPNSLRSPSRKRSTLKLMFHHPKDDHSIEAYLEIHGEEIAKQLTKNCFDIYKKIQSVELFKQSWSKPKTQHLSPNVIQMINLFNEVSGWVAAAIVQEPTLKSRTSVMTSLLKIAKHLKKLKNYHLLIAFISGLNNSSVSRLKWTFKKLPVKYKTLFSKLELLMSVEGAFKNYRTAYSQVQLPTIPYMGVTLQDLTFTDENPDKLGELINFEKQKLLYQIITDTLKSQNVGYKDIEVNEDVQVFLHRLAALIITDKELHEKSLQIEPRNSQKSEIK